MSDSASSSTVNIKTEIVRLVEIQEEKAELLSYFTKHKDQQDDALSDLNYFDTNENKLAYLRTFLKPDTFFLSKCEHPIKKHRIEQGWKSYTASDGHSVELPSQIIDMLESYKFVPDPRATFRIVFQNLHVGQSITLPNLGQEPKHFAEGYQGRTLLITGQMIDIWDKLSADSDHSIKRVLSGPMGVGKSYISYFLASKAYAEEWPILYIADASDLNVESSKKAGEVICRYFLALNKDILTATELKRIVRNVNDPSAEVEVIIAEEILDLIKLADRKALLIVDEHGILFEKDPVPLRIHLLSPLMNLNFWGEHYKFARVIFTGTAHARYEREYMKNGQYEFWVIYVGPLQSNVFDILLQLHPVLRIQGIKEEAKKITNCVPRELIYLVEYIKNLNITITNVNCFRQVLKKFEIERVDKILVIAQKYYNDLPKTEKTRYYDALTSMFLPSKPIVQFEWKFLDLGLIYRYKEGITHYLPLCPSAQKALLKMYMSFDLSENIKNQLRVGSLTGEQFEEALFNRLVCKCNITIQLNVTDLNNNNRNVITLQFNDYDLIKNSQLSLGPGNDKVLGRGFDRYPRFDYMLGPIFIQVSISDFTSHNSKSSTNIRQAFEPMSAQAGISLVQINGRNQIEMYLDEMYGPGHSAKIDSQNRFVVTRNGRRVPGFRIVYIRGSPGTPNHSGKVREFPDVSHVTFEEIKSQLFPNIV
ncbi:11414_t:CDS:2 [Funneliformis geosporum]|nr:11414_t:CDS:2 [Funneliformis geosporum]